MPTILVVDDEAVVRTVLNEVLTAEDRVILLAAGAEEALAHATSLDSLDLAIVDKNLENSNGVDLVRRLRELHAGAEYVLITAYPSVESAAEAVRLRLYDYVTKPFDITELDAVVAGALDRAAQRRADAEQRAHDLERAEAASRDQLTRLPSRDAFVEHVDAVLAAAKRDPTRAFAVLVFNLDGFGVIIDGLGHSAGDDLLVQWVERVSRLLRWRDLLARVGADELTLLMEDLEDPAEAVGMAERLKRAAALPFALGNRQVSLTVRVGIALSAERYERGEELLRDAGAAAAHAKRAGRGRHAIFVDEMHSRAVEQLTLDEGLRRAVEHGEFVAYYQPILSVESGRVVAFEALARWRHPERGLLLPAEFLDRAVEGGFLTEIAWQVICDSVDQQRRWLDRFGHETPLTMHVNVPPTVLLRRHFVEDIERLLQAAGLKPSCLKVEITEAVAMDATEVSAEVMQTLRKRGIAVCLDDFGTGYASLSWLHSFPVDELKIDKSFVAAMSGDRRSQILVGAAVNLAHSLGLAVVAEGVETQEQLDELTAMSCEYVQGFLFAKAMPAAHAEAYMRKRIAAALRGA